MYHRNSDLSMQKEEQLHWKGREPDDKNTISIYVVYFHCLFQLVFCHPVEARHNPQMDHAAVHIWLKGVSAHICLQVSQQAHVTEEWDGINTDVC